MVEAVYLVERTSQGESDDRNRVRAVVVNNDDGDADAVVIANVITLLNAAQPVEDGREPIYRAGYFDLVTEIGDLAGTGENNLRTDGDFIAFGAAKFDVRTPLV